MIFVGDIAIPNLGAIKYKSISNKFIGKKWFGNLEGGIINENRSEYKEVYNDFSAIDGLVRDFDFVGFALANNHMTDSCSVTDTTSYLSDLKVPFCGAGSNLEESNKELILFEDNVKIVIINFGWEVIQCDIATVNSPGVNPLKRDYVLDKIRNLVSKHPDGKVIAFLHWSYELEGEPQPFERELGRKIIENGAKGVVGCHPHRIGGIEFHQGCPIIYSLGNWLFQQGFYHSKKLKFPDFCNRELAVEWCFNTNEIYLHFFNYDRNKHELTYVESKILSDEVAMEMTPFYGMSAAEYNRWYKSNHFHKNKGLPIYYWRDSDWLINFKNSINKMRDRLLKTLLKLR